MSSSPVSANVFVSLGKILNLACLVDPSDIWVAVIGDVTALKYPKNNDCLG